MLPGAREVLTQGLTVRPFSTAFLATRPAAIITEGLEVLVHEVIEAMATAPCLTVNDPSAAATSAVTSWV